MLDTERDLICFSHLRWGFVFQRPQHLMARFARRRRVYFFEEPIFEGDAASIRKTTCEQTGVHIITPVLPARANGSTNQLTREVLNSFLKAEQISSYVTWFYTPMALEFASHLNPAAVVYDCMDELSMFKGAPPELHQNERRLFQLADLVFTGGASLFEAKQGQHPRVHLFPSSVDVAHFSKARAGDHSPEDQRNIPHPRIGYAGVIDERMDLDLLRGIAQRSPEWQFIMVGPVVKIDPASLPKESNIHYLGMKSYQDLPAYFSGWDVAMLPFAINDSTRFISPTKTPEYLSAGLRVVSTPIRDVVRPYGELGVVSIAATAHDFATAIGKCLAEGAAPEWRKSADGFVGALSWDQTWAAMNKLIINSIAEKRRPAVKPPDVKPDLNKPFEVKEGLRRSAAHV
jgi:UDP-galactopyranose mutase